MAAGAIKELGSFSLDVLHNQINQNPLSKEPLRELEELAKLLTKSPARAKFTRARESDQVAFKSEIVPEIQRSVKDFNMKGKNHTMCV